MQICYDQEFPEATREMTLKGAEIVCELMAWEHFIGDTLEEEGKRVGYPVEQFGIVRAMENQIYFVTSNMVGKNEMGDFCGASQIVDPNGLVLASCGTEECIVYADVDVREGIISNRATWLLKCVKDRKPHAYKCLANAQNLQGMTPLQDKDNIAEIK